MEIEDKKVKSVQLINRSPTKLPSWFEQHQYKLFEVDRQTEGGFDVDLAPCGHPGETGFLSNKEVRIVEYYDEV